MDFEELMQARIDEYERQVARGQRQAEARPYTPTGRRWPNPLAGFDRFVLRASKGASERQARRSNGHTPQGAA